MISIVVCSINPELFDALKESIEKTIGLPDYELIKINNRIENLSIAKAYNKGLAAAKHNIVVFVHEDVIFHTQGWGGILLGHFEAHPKAGLIGVAGSTIKLRAPSSWFNVPEKFHVKNIIQHNGQKVAQHEVIGWEQNDGSFKEIAVSDGVLFALRKIKGALFNEQIQGFHGYDLAISIIYKNLGLSVYATKKILIEHFSSGVTDKSWLKALYSVSCLYKNQLPIIFHKVGSLKNLEIETIKWFIHRALDFNEKKIAFFCLTGLLSRQPLSLQNLVIVKRLLFG